MSSFLHRSRIEAPARDVFDWHKRPGAFERLLPPWERVKVVERSGGIRDGDRVVIKSRLGPTWTRWVIEHRDYIEGVQFRDIQISGPFRCWEHTHRVVPEGESACILEDEISYELPLGAAGSLLGGRFLQSQLRRMFNYRHAVTRADLLAHQAGQRQGSLRVLVSGSTGLIGSNLVPLLSTGGHQVMRLSRKNTGPNDPPAFWDTETGHIELTDSGPLDAVVHLAGESIAGRWTHARKRRILETRVRGTRQITEWIAKLEEPPRVFACASAIGYYGDRGSESLTEQSSRGNGFLADVCDAWESAAAPARRECTRLVQLRFGMVLSSLGGGLAKMLTPFNLGAGGKIGDGRQTWSWISIDDAAGAVLHAMHCKDLEGPVNIVAPQPATNREFTKTLGKILHRPVIAPMPRVAARLAFGEMADELLLSSQRVLPERLQQTQYRFRHADLDTALRHLLGKMA